MAIGKLGIFMRQRLPVVSRLRNAVLLTVAMAVAGAMPAAAGPNGDAIAMSSQNASGESGAADVMAVNGGIKVFVHIMQNASPAAQAAQIVSGHCDESSGSTRYQLADLVGGKSETTIPDVTLDEINGRIYGQPSNGEYAIVVRRSAADPTIVACGDLRP
jgi:hypothetical protein